jgi:hypothetical protein
MNSVAGSEFPLTGCRSLVRGIRLALLRAGDVESNPEPDGGPCVGCGLTPAANTRVLLRCREGCGRQCHCREACSGLRRGEQRQGIWTCGMCVVVSGGVAPPQPQSSQVPPPAAFSQPFGHESLPSQPGYTSQTKLHHLAHRVAPVGGAVLAGAAQSPPGRGVRVSPVAPDPGDSGGGGVLALEVALMLESGFPPNLNLGLAPGTGPILCPSIPW